MPSESWSTSLHLTFRLLPAPTASLRPFLEAEGLTPDQLLTKLPYAAARSRTGRGAPDPRRYRDGKQLYESIGLIYESSNGIVRITDLGHATLRWLDLLNDRNIAVLGRHAAYALAACQLRNPTGWGNYDASFEVFPFSCIWRVMLALDGCISSDELNRVVFRIKTEKDLNAAIQTIQAARNSGASTTLPAETVTGENKEDRIIPWMCMASFGWTLISDKRGGEGRYCINPRARNVLREAASVRHKHRTFDTPEQYVQHIAKAAALPEDLR